MSTKVIVSYDGTNNEDDAIAFGRLLAQAGAELSLAYVLHATQPGDQYESLGDREASQLLARGAELLGDENVPRHIITDRSTPEGLRTLAEREGAEAIVFCSDSHTASGYVSVGNSAQRLLDGGRFAIGIASSGLADRDQLSIHQIAVNDDPGDPSPRAVADGLASVFGAQVTPATEKRHGADLLILGSRPEAGQGQVALSAAAMNLIEDEVGGVLVLPRGSTLRLTQHTTVSA
jgi:nucleotide-binding universal stress UspA family protein